MRLAVIAPIVLFLGFGLAYDTADNPSQVRALYARDASWGLGRRGTVVSSMNPNSQANHRRLSDVYLKILRAKCLKSVKPIDESPEGACLVSLEEIQAVEMENIELEMMVVENAENHHPTSSPVNHKGRVGHTALYEVKVFGLPLILRGIARLEAGRAETPQLRARLKIALDTAKELIHAFQINDVPWVAV